MSKIAAIQMCSSFNVDDNLQVAATLIAEAATNHAVLIVLPEMFAIMGDKMAVKEHYGHGKIQACLAELARQHKIWIIAGTIPIVAEDKNKVRAASLVFNDKGETVARYDKIHLFDVDISSAEIYRESDTIEAGDKVVVVDTPVGKIGMAVCYDVRFPALFQRLFKAGTEILVLPSAFTVKTGTAHWELLTRARAVENFCYVIGAAQGGTHANGRQTYGHSLIVAPWGNVVAEKTDDKPGVIYAEIDLDEVYKARKAIPIAQHQKNLQ